MNKKIIIIIGAVVAVLLIVVGVVLFVVVGSEPKEEEAVYNEFALGESYANLQGGNIVKYQVTIQYTGEEETSAILTANKTAIDNNINEIMRMKSLDDLEQSNSMERLRTEIQDMVIDLLEVDETVISNVYFVQYVTQ